jgi:NAD(P)-dependent dehydrogenase (short-subunit alcohol dehydrogenase family)
MTNDLSSKVIVITGASSGIGRATAIKLSTLGARLALTGRRPDALAETNRQCGGNHLTAIFDISDAAATRNFVDMAFKTYGKIDHVFNNAGKNPTTHAIQDVKEEYWDEMINTNLKGLFNVTKAIAPLMLPGSSFVNHSSISGIRAAPNIAVYCATKFAIIGFSQSMALELGPKGIRTNIIAPGYIDTPTNISVLEGANSIHRANAEVSLGRMGTPEDVAGVVAFMFSEQAQYMNGSVVEVNGGIK